MRSSSSTRSTEDGLPNRPGKWRLKVVVLAILLIALSWDLSRKPAKQWSSWLILGGIDLYQCSLSPGLSRIGVRCRFEPTCSHYASVSIEKHGALRGSWRSAGRLVRCGPWTAAGTPDPP